MGGVGWHTVNPTLLCKAAQYQSSVHCPKTTAHFLDILLHSIRKLLLWGKFWGALLFLKELLQIEDIKSIRTLVNKVSNSTEIKKLYSGSVMWWHNYCKLSSGEIIFTDSMKFTLTLLIVQQKDKKTFIKKSVTWRNMFFAFF